jgi:hypothetical protein
LQTHYLDLCYSSLYKESIIQVSYLITLLKQNKIKDISFQMEIFKQMINIHNTRY